MSSQIWSKNGNYGYVQRPGNDGGGDNLALLCSTECGHLWIFGVGGSTIEERNLTIPPVKVGRVLEVLTTLLEFVAPLVMTGALPVT